MEKWKRGTDLLLGFKHRYSLLVNPEDEMVERYCLVNGQYLSADVFNWDEALKLVALPDITINLWEIFARQQPQENGAI